LVGSAVGEIETEVGASLFLDGSAVGELEMAAGVSELVIEVGALDSSNLTDGESVNDASDGASVIDTASIGAKVSPTSSLLVVVVLLLCAAVVDVVELSSFKAVSSSFVLKSQTLIHSPFSNSLRIRSHDDSDSHSLVERVLQSNTAVISTSLSII
jgi:hypothetical protein